MSAPAPLPLCRLLLLMLRITHHILPQKEAVLGMLRSKLQEEGLRTYLLAYGRFYSSLSIAQLCDMFELPERKVGAARGLGRTVSSTLPRS